MGQGITVKCRSCDAEENYMLGVGMLYFPLENVLDSAVPKRQREKVRRALKIAGQEGAEYSHKLFACPRCETLTTRFYIKIARGEEILFETKFRCGKCRQALVPVPDDDVSHYLCPACGKRTLESYISLMWD